PKFDLSVVPTFGDKDADLKLGITGVSATDDYAVRVIDSNPVQAQLGVNATNGAWGFGLNYKLGVGSDDRMNNSFNANVRYAF
ncbi:MAG: autotransporter outer membrane beta-barrel domain-containing protein, partial [Sutterella sp.]|nr:autotransporter outer membrane beta-barrel domain-containing protein [Sutterella sp.]